jgi:voltage-gated potassium channel
VIHLFRAVHGPGADATVGGTDRKRCAVACGAARRRGDLGMALRSAVMLVLLLVAYYRAPLDRPLTIRSGLLFALVLLVLAIVVVVEVRGILASPRPLQRAIRMLAVGVPTFLVVFASTYCTIDAHQPDAFSEPLSRTDGLYFTVTTFATVGYGDISPRSELARVLVTVQMLAGLLVVGIVAKVVLGAVRVARERNTAAHRVETSEL